MLLPYLNTLNNEKRIVLASASTMRRQILTQAGLTSFTISPSGFAEDLPKSDFPNSIAYVIKTSEHKLHDKVKEFKEAIATSQEGAEESKFERADIVIASDTIISFQD